MNMKSKRGYSLIEIAVGILILTVFLICSAALFNGAYNTYRMIQQRNLAINLAVTNMETLLQTDSNILTGFFVENRDETTNEYSLTINEDFADFVELNFDLYFIDRYAKLNNMSIDAVGTLSEEDFFEYIYADVDYLANAYIRELINNAGTLSEETRNGDYAFLKENVQETGNMALINPGSLSAEELNNYLGETMAVRTTVLRLPIADDQAFGNRVLKLKVEVLYTNKIDLMNLTDADVKVITLESVKISE